MRTVPSLLERRIKVLDPSLEHILYQSNRSASAGSHLLGSETELLDTIVFMAKPRTFISSTCFDFADARASIAKHLKELGHEPLLSDSPSFGVSLGKHSHVACLDQVENSEYLVLLIGGRRGGTFVGSEKSITNEEYRHALKKYIPTRPRNLRLRLGTFMSPKPEVPWSAPRGRENQLTVWLSWQAVRLQQPNYKSSRVDARIISNVQ